LSGTYRQQLSIDNVSYIVLFKICILLMTSLMLRTHAAYSTA